MGEKGWQWADGGPERAQGMGLRRARTDSGKQSRDRGLGSVGGAWGGEKRSAEGKSISLPLRVGRAGRVGIKSLFLHCE